MTSQKEKILSEIEETWSELQQAIASVPTERMEEAGVVEAWSVKDIMGHVTTWDREAIDRIDEYLKDDDLVALETWTDVDGMNARESAKKQAMPLDEICADMDTTHQEALQLIASLTEEQIGLPQMQKRIAIDVYNHYREHTGHINEWVARKKRYNNGVAH